ncbi:MAG: MFS transporter [Chloroflexi bacterium]|nr:MAG: MFS transporter [Chloroflexota bacterium]
MIEPKSSTAARLGAWTGAGTPLVLFITLGLPAGVIGVAWPHMRASLGAPLAGLGLLLAAFTVGYFVASAGSGPVTFRFGTATLLVGGCALASIGSLGLSLAGQWWIVPLVGLVLGAGSGLIDAAVNAHVSLNRGVRYMGWLHASWALGAALGPPLVVISLAATGSWRASFAALAVAFLGVGLIVGSRRRDWIHTTSIQHAVTTTPVPAEYRRALVVLTCLCFLGGGLEATAGDWSYTQLTVGRSLSAGLASTSASLFWAGLAAGRVALGLLGNRVAPIRLLDAGITVATVAAVAFWLAPTLVSALVALPVLGAAVSLIFPLLLSITPTRVGATMTPHAVGYQLAAGTLGGGGIPALTGLALQAAGLLALGPVLATISVALLLLHLISRLGRADAG